MSQSLSLCAGVSPQFWLQSSAAAPYATDYYPSLKKQSVTATTFVLTCSLRAVLNVVVEFWILLLPLSVVWTLQLPNRQKVAVTCIFLLGAL